MFSMALDSKNYSFLPSGSNISAGYQNLNKVYQTNKTALSKFESNFRTRNRTIFRSIQTPLKISGDSILSLMTNQVKLQDFTFYIKQTNDGFVYEDDKLGFYVETDSKSELYRMLNQELAYLYDEIYFSEKPKLDTLEPLLFFLESHISR